MSALLFLILAATGVLLKFQYVPSPAEAYDSILRFENELYFGRLVRNMHHWSAILFVWTSFLHLLRVVYTGAFYGKRKTNWYIGIAMLLFVIFSNFTGYLLAWDQLSYWAIKISTNLVEYIPLAGNPIKETLLGGKEISQQTLLNFYNLHTGFLPMFFFLLMMWHFWKVRRAGGVVLSPEAKESEMIKSNPHLIAREAVVALVLFAILVVLSSFFDVGLLERANPYQSPNPAKAPWYFMGFQEMLIHFPPFVVINIFPLLILGLFIWIPFTKENQNQGVWFSSERGKKSVIQFAIISFAVTILLIISEHFIIKSLFDTNKLPLLAKQISMLVVFSGIFTFLLFLFRKKYNLTSFETIQLTVTSLAVVYVSFSIIGIFFRGYGMALMFPWQF